MPRALTFAAIAIAAILTLLVRTARPDEAFAVLVGIVFGIATTLPVSAGLWAALAHHWDHGDAEADEELQVQSVPPLPPAALLMTSPVRSAPMYAASGPDTLWPSPYASASEFRVIGDN